MNGSEDMAQAAKSDPRIHVDADRLRRLGAQAGALSLLPHQPARSVLNGRHGSRLRGRGLNFEELRTYVPGDDIRTIDWKVTARTGEPHVRVYTEERDRPALLIVDQRMSMFFGSVEYMKSVIAAEAAAIAATTVLKQGDRVGAIIFGDDNISEHAPKRRPATLNRIIASLARANQRLDPSLETPPNPAELNDVLRAAIRITGSNALVMVFSDFDGMTDQTESLLRKLAVSNDLVAFNVADPLGLNPPEEMRITVSDGGLQAELDTRDPELRTRLRETMSERLENLFSWSLKYGFPVVPLTTETPALDQIMAQFGHQRGPRR